VVKLDFYYFNTQPDADYVYIYDGEDGSAPLLGQLSGTYCSPPAGFTTTQQYMFIQFTSDGKTNFNGFGATFSTAEYGKRPLFALCVSDCVILFTSNIGH
jgi:CUB domain